MHGDPCKAYQTQNFVKILLYSINYLPELTGIGKYTGEMAEWLASRGHEIRVVTAPPYYPAWKVQEDYASWQYTWEMKKGIQVWRCPLYVPNNPTGFKRLLHLASFAISSMPIVLRQALWKPDVLFVIEPPLFCSPTALIAARLTGSKCWLHVQDFEVDAAFMLGLLPKWLQGMVEAVERWLMQRFDVLSSISESMCARLEEKGISNPRLFPNWADLTRMHYDAQGRTIIRNELGLDEKGFLCLYSGNMAEKQGLEIVLDVAERLSDMFFLLCGEGPKKSYLVQETQNRRLHNVTFWPLQPEERLPALLSAADIHLVVQRRDAADLVMPSKLVNIMAVEGTAVVTADEETELGRLALRNPRVVLRCDPENTEALAQAIKLLATNPNLRRHLGKAARRYATENLSREYVLSRWEQWAKNCIGMS